MAFLNGDVVRYDSAGTEQARLSVGIGALSDIALSADGQVAVTHPGTDAKVALLDTSLSAVHVTFSVGDSTAAVQPSVTFEEDWSAFWSGLGLTAP